LAKPRHGRKTGKKKPSQGKNRRGKTRGKSGLPRTIVPARHQTGTAKNAYLDSKRRALKPGKRISKSGKVYYEYRANRSDLGRT